MHYADYYAILGLEKGAGDKEIRQAYRRLAKAYHPDTHPGNTAAEQKFKEINEAYEVLSDPQKRSRYDQLGAHWQDFSEFAESFNTHQRNRHRVEVNSELFDLPFSDFFEIFFGEQAEGFWDKYASDLRQKAPPHFQSQTDRHQAQDISYTAQISLEEALHGTKRRIQLRENDTLKTLEVKIPPGVKEGSKIRIGAPENNIFLEIHLRPHPFFTPEGLNLHGRIKIMDYEAMLGTSQAVGTLTGNIQIKIPPGSQTGQIFRVKGQGLPQLEQPEERGDLLLTLEIKTSRNLSAAERELITRFRLLREGQSG